MTCIASFWGYFSEIQCSSIASFGPFHIITGIRKTYFCSWDSRHWALWCFNARNWENLKKKKKKYNLKKVLKVHITDWVIKWMIQHKRRPIDLGKPKRSWQWMHRNGWPCDRFTFNRKVQVHEHLLLFILFYFILPLQFPWQWWIVNVSEFHFTVICTISDSEEHTSLLWPGIVESFSPIMFMFLAKGSRKHKSIGGTRNMIGKQQFTLIPSYFACLILYYIFIYI